MEIFQGKVWGDNDQDFLKLDILFFIQTFILSREKRAKKVSVLHFDLAESGKCSNFPWGKKAFHLLMKSLSKKFDSSKKFYIIGGMPIVIQVCLYECNSSIDIQVAQKADNHILRNITPTPRELSILQLPSKGIEIQVEGQYSDSLDDDSTSYEKYSDDDFQEPPSPIIKDKRKGKVGSSPSHIKKRTKKHLLDGAKQGTNPINL
ncbi:hypothetical protein RDI58_019982 [Solanum bulbocastanum]|uniref:DUF1985 domain-containing protein n=1 Tax=Solanum bulbocastanum TaxID=147425 RepID=A0AAN8Y851_SOLBU